MEIKDKFKAQKILMYIYGYLRALKCQEQAEDVSDVVQYLNTIKEETNGSINKSE